MILDIDKHCCDKHGLDKHGLDKHGLDIKKIARSLGLTFNLVSIAMGADYSFELIYFC